MKHITKEQRYQIQAYLRSGKSKCFIGKELGIHPSSLGREIKRNAQKRGGYDAAYAHKLAQERKERFNKCRRFDNQVKKTIDHYLLNEQWSPEQIVGYCKNKNIKMVSHERIYQYIRQDKKSGGSLYKSLRHRLKHRKRPVGGKQSAIANKVSINERPDVINNKERFGDWEIDTIVGPDNGAIVTIVERLTGFLMMQNLSKGRKSDDLAEEVNQLLLPYKDHAKSMTSDNGPEFAQHQKIAEKLNLDFYFANPYSSWERGLNEYTNKLIRQYIPKKQNLKNISELEIREIQHKINRRPRKKLNYKSPTQVFYNLVG